MYILVNTHCIAYEETKYFFMYIYYNISMMHSKFEKHYSYKHYHREMTLLFIRTVRP